MERGAPREPKADVALRVAGAAYIAKLPKLAAIAYLSSIRIRLIPRSTQFPGHPGNVGLNRLGPPFDQCTGGAWPLIVEVVMAKRYEALNEASCAGGLLCACFVYLVRFKTKLKRIAL